MATYQVTVALTVNVTVKARSEAAARRLAAEVVEGMEPDDRALWWINDTHARGPQVEGVTVETGPDSIVKTETI